MKAIFSIFLVGIFSFSASASLDDCAFESENSPLSEVQGLGWVKITRGPQSVEFGNIDVLEPSPQNRTSNFTVKASRESVYYSVWLSVPQENLDRNRRVYLARQADAYIPLRVKLLGQTQHNVINTDPALLQSTGSPSGRPRTSQGSDGDHVSGTSCSLGSTYTIELTFDPALLDGIEEIPEGHYSLNLTAHVQVD